jgi:hypothetical protein
MIPNTSEMIAHGLISTLVSLEGVSLLSGIGGGPGGEEGIFSK